MGDITGFLKYDRADQPLEEVARRVTHFGEFTLPREDSDIRTQAARCMDCGIPFCHTGCPLNNQIPDWNDLVYSSNWAEASQALHATNNFPEFTGAVCPAPCEYACTLYLENQPVTIKNIEMAIIERAWQEGWVRPEVCSYSSGYRVAIIGSGPAGMAAAQQLARVGHAVTVFEREKYIGGLLRYGIPDFKMEKECIERRRQQMEAEGVVFRCGVNVGREVSLADLQATFDAVAVCIGAERPREVGIGGLHLGGVHYAMPYLTEQNKRVSGETIAAAQQQILATDKDVVVIGGGDTASDCIGTAIRQGCRSVTQLDIRPQPPEHENKGVIWPYWPTKMRTSSSQEEGAKREFAVATIGTEVADDGVTAVGVKCAQVDDSRSPLPGSEFVIDAQLILHAIGFAGPLPQPLLEQMNVATDARSNIAADTQTYMTSTKGLFAAGDVRRGQSLIVWAIAEGRQAARSIDEWLNGSSVLPR